MKQCGWGRKRAKGAGVMAGILAGIFLVFLGCGGCGQGRQNAQDVSGAVPAYQFAPGFGIIAHSPYPVYVLEDENGYAVSKDGVKVELVRGMMQDNALIAELRILDYRKDSRGDDRGADSWIYDIRCFGPGIPDTGRRWQSSVPCPKYGSARGCWAGSRKEQMYRKDIGRLYGRIRNHKRQVKQIPAFLDKEYL